MAPPGNNIDTFTPSRLWRTVRLTLALLLVALALSSTVGYARSGEQRPASEANALVEPAPPKAEDEPPPITLPPAEPGEDEYIAEVAIESTEQLEALQRIGYSCEKAVACEIVASEAQLSALEEAGFGVVDIIGVVAESRVLGEAQSSYQSGLDESSVSGANYTDYLIDDGGSARSIINISGAPWNAKVTKVKYTCNVQATSAVAMVSDYGLEISHFMVPTAYMIWNHSGGWTDEGFDDDAADDKDIYLSGRWITGHFDGQPVNQPWMLTASDPFWQLGAGFGHIDYWILYVYYCTAGADAPALSTPGNNVHTCDTTPAFDWASVTGADLYQMQVDDSSSFASPAIDGVMNASDFSPTSPLTRKKWYWRVRARNECGYGLWSAPWTFYIDSSPAVPVLQSPANGSHTCDTTPAFDWADAAGALQYRIQVDDSASFSSPAINTIRTVSGYTPSTALAPDHYYWRVSGESACGRSAWSAVRDLYIDTAPAKPSGPSPADGATDVGLEADLHWASSAGATSYDVYFGTSLRPPFVANVRGNQYTLPALSANTRYYWKVEAKNSCGTSGAPVWSFTTGSGPCNSPSTPSQPSPIDGARGVGLEADLDWDSSAEASSYDVYFGTSLAPPFVATVRTSQYTLPTLSASTRYYWKVVAKNSCGSTQGPVWRFTTGEYAPTPTDTATSTPTPTQSPTPTPTRTPTLGPVGTHRVYLPMVLKQSPGVLRITLGQNNIERGLSLGQARDADTEVVWVGSPSMEARQTGNGQALPAADGNQILDYYLQIRVDDSVMYAGSPTTRVRVELEYFDLGTDTFDLTYDALPSGPSEDGRFKLAGQVTKGDTGRFRTAEFVLCDANFANRDNDADFRIGDNADGPETIRSISVTLLSPGPCGG
jgi:hypothetical protein